MQDNSGTRRCRAKIPARACRLTEDGRTISTRSTRRQRRDKPVLPGKVGPQRKHLLGPWRITSTWKTCHHPSSALIPHPLQILVQLPWGELPTSEMRLPPSDVSAEPCNFPSYRITGYNHRYLCDCWDPVVPAALQVSQVGTHLTCSLCVSRPSTAAGPPEGISTHLVNQWTNNMFLNYVTEGILHCILSSYLYCSYDFFPIAVLSW